MSKNVEQMCIPVSNEIKIPRGSKKISSGDIVYYMSPKGVLNLSRKLTLRWTGPYRVISTPSESLSVIDPIGGWAVNRRELHVLTSRLKKVNPEYSRLTSEQIDLDQLTQREAEEEEVSFTPQESLTYSTSAPSELSRPREIIVDSSEDDEEYIPMRNQWSERPLHSPENIFPSIETPREMSTENHIIVQPSMIKIEVNPDESLPQAEATLPQALDQPPVGKRK